MRGERGSPHAGRSGPDRVLLGDAQVDDSHISAYFRTGLNPRNFGFNLPSEVLLTQLEHDYAQPIMLKP